MQDDILTGIVNRAFVDLPLGLFAVYIPFGILFVVCAVKERAFYRLWQAALVLVAGALWVAGGSVLAAHVWWGRVIGTLLLATAAIWGRSTGTKLLAWEQNRVNHDSLESPSSTFSPPQHLPR